MNVDRGPLLQLDDVSLEYFRRGLLLRKITKPVLKNVSVSLCRGETLGVIGRNGCGKSTLLRLMAGIIGPTSGEITLTPGVSRAVLALGLGFRGDLTGRDNAYLSSVLQGNSRVRAKGFLEDIKEFSELGEAFETPVKTYSSGMRARLGFSTALVSHVDILLIDEVLSVGDGHFRKKANEAIKDKIRGEQTVVFVSHSAGQVKELCDRALWLHQGQIRRLGDCESVVEEYESTL